MALEESGTVVEVRGPVAVVRLRRSAACSGCASAGHCHAGKGEREQLLEARNPVGAGVGDAVRVAVPARAVLGASARIYLLPVAGLLLVAAAAQWVVGSLVSPDAGETAAGIGGIVGVVLGVVVARMSGKRSAAHGGPVAVVTEVLGVPPAPV